MIFFLGGEGWERMPVGIPHRSRYPIVAMYPLQVYDVQSQLRIQKIVVKL